MSKKSAHSGPHKYYKMPMGTGFVWACALEECSHYIPRNLTEQIRNRKSICWKCEEEFSFSRNVNALEMDKPECLSCKGDVEVKPEDNQTLEDLIANFKSSN